ncbi:MAG TPA: OsmC family protein [Candidatus Limnocylindria bacterium]|nr:OsmC family protein [Candidatus Limnocylindria bacterium]
MLGTLLGALEARQVHLGRDQHSTEVEGINQVRDGLPVLTEIRVHYRLRIPPGTREKVDRALARHLERCPTAASLEGAVAVSWTAEVEEAT